MNTIKNIVFSNWNFMRWFRFVISLIIIIQAFKTHEAAIGLIGAFFFLQAITNTGCGGTNGCNVLPSTPKSDKKTEVEFEEIKKQ